MTGEVFALIEVLRAGFQATIQDWPGRVGMLRLGIYPAGPMDSLAFRLGNLLVGNSPGAPGIEIMAGNFEVRFNEPRLIAITGANMSPQLNGSPVPMWQTIEVKEGDVLTLGWLKGAGFTAYLCVSGGVVGKEDLGSVATFSIAKLGGIDGRPLQKGDIIPLRPWDNRGYVRRRLRKNMVPTYDFTVEIAAMRGPQADPDFMTSEDMEFFFTHEWKVDRNSSRVGIRLEPHKWQWARRSGGVAGGHPSNILDNGYPVFAVNVTGDQPVILPVDGPSLGGFICCATIVSAEAWKLGQIMPGRDKIRFREVTLKEARDLARKLEEYLANSIEEVD